MCQQLRKWTRLRFALDVLVLRPSENAMSESVLEGASLAAQARTTTRR